MLHEIWPKNDDTAKLRCIRKVTKSFAYDEDTKACKKRLDRLAISTVDFYAENYHLHYFTKENSNNCVVYGAAEGILQSLIETSMIVVILFKR